MAVVETDRGTFTIKRKGTKAFSVMEVKRLCVHKGKRRQPGDYVTIDHRAIPESPAAVMCGGNGWARWLACYDMEGNKLFGPDIPQASPQRAYTQADIERARAQAFSAAADTACNEWNRLQRTREWCAMAGHFQVIWKNMKSISDDYHKIADEMQQKEAAGEPY